MDLMKFLGTPASLKDTVIKLRVNALRNWENFELGREGFDETISDQCLGYINVFKHFMRTQKQMNKIKFALHKWQPWFQIRFFCWNKNLQDFCFLHFLLILINDTWGLHRSLSYYASFYLHFSFITK